MADDFDLLETNSQEKNEKVDVNWGKAIDTMKSKLAQEDDPESRQKILNATLDDVVHMAEKDRTTLLDAIEANKVDCAIGGGRRDEEKARAKERFFSHRDEFGQWDPKNQRPELWNIFNGKKHFGENFRVFPISNWTELDVWSYIQKESIEIPSIYFAHKRNTFLRDGLIWSAEDDVVFRADDEQVEERMVRFRTVGDMSCTAAVESHADTIDKVVAEIRDSRISERGAHIDDKRSEAAMEKRKQQGYF